MINLFSDKRVALKNESHVLHLLITTNVKYKKLHR